MHGRKNMKGKVKITSYDKEGNVVQQLEDSNVVVLLGKDSIGKLLAQNVDSNPVDYKISYVVLSNGDAPLSEDLTSFDSTSTYNSGSVPVMCTPVKTGNFQTTLVFKAALDKSQGNGPVNAGVTYTEAALVCNNMAWFAYKKLGSIIKNDSLNLGIEWTIDLNPAH
jgi:hypothetical protein